MSSTPSPQDEAQATETLRFCKICRKRTTKELCPEHEAKLSTINSELPYLPTDTLSDIPKKDNEKELKGGNEK